MAITLSEIHTLGIGLRDTLPKRLDVPTVHIAEVQPVKGGRCLESAQRGTVELGTTPPVNSAARTSKEVHVHEFRPLSRSSLWGHGRHERPSVPLDVRKLVLAPQPADSSDQAVRRSADHPVAVSKTTSRGVGISSHVRSSRTRPPDFG